MDQHTRIGERLAFLLWASAAVALPWMVMPMLAQFDLPGDVGEQLTRGVLKLGLAVSVFGAVVWLGLRLWRLGGGALRHWPHWLAGLAALQALLGLLALDAIAAWGGIWLGAQSLVVVILSLFEDHPLAEG